jgi:hypothetical protein
MTKWQLDPDLILAGFEPATFSFEGGHYNHSATHPVIVVIVIDDKSQKWIRSIS